MRSLETSKYSHGQVKDALLGNRTIGYRFELLNNREQKIGDITASGSMSVDTEARIVQCAQLNIKELGDIDRIDDRIKPYMRVHIGNDIIEYPLGVFIISAPDRDYDGYSVSKSCQCYDKSVILTEDKFDTRYRIAKDTVYTTAVTAILYSAGFSFHNIIPSDYTLSQDIEYEIGTTKLDAINSLLKAINYNNLHFDAQGVPCSEPYIEPPFRTVEESYATDQHSVILPAIRKTIDVFNYPNKIIRYIENPEAGTCIKGVYTNNSAESPLSTTSRGRTIVDVETVDDIADQDTMNAYVRRLAYQMQVQEVIKFSTCNMPHHDYLDCLAVDIPECSVAGKYIEYAWEMDLSNGGNMTHHCRRVVELGV